MSSDDGRITSEALRDHIQLAHVDTLTDWENSAWSGDVGARAVQSAVFGNLELVLTHGDVVLHGADRVEAERFEGRDDGMVPVVDLQSLGYSRAKAEAAVLSIRTHYDRDRADPHMLAELVTSLATEAPEAAVGAGWDGDSIDTLMAALDELGPSDLRDDIGDDGGLAPLEPPEGPPVTQPGDIWTLGPHRIMCGDCRDPEDVATLLDGATVNLAFTSPPYADRRTYDENSGFKPIPPDEYVDWFEPVQANVATHLTADGSWFVNIKAGTDGLDLDTYVLDLVLGHARPWGWHWASEYCWERVSFPQRVERRLKNQFEPVYHFALGPWKFRPDNVAHASDAEPYTNSDPALNNQGTGRFETYASANGLAYPGNRLPTFAGSHEATGHAAAFPIGLPDFFVRAYTDEGDTVFDPFMGSGSTLLAAHQNDRVGFGMEISPKYCDVICARWELVTGIKPERDGAPHSFVEAG